MDIKINNWTKGRYSSIFRVAGKKGNTGALGQRYPAIWALPTAGQIHIASNNGANTNWWKNVKVPTGKWFRIDIWQKKNDKVFTFGNA